MLRHAQSLATQAVMALEGDRLSQAALQHELVQEEMEIGSEMQRILLLGDKPSALGFAQVASLAIPSQKLGGDFLEFFHLSGMHLDILIGDVMGKGLRASLVGAAITRQFHRTLCSLVTADPNCHAAPETIVSSVHEGVARRLAEFDSFVTLDYARVDAFRGRLDYVDCGHPPILHFRKALGRCDALYGKNVPLGFSDLEVYEQVSVPYEDGDVFVFYSDGVTELRNAAGELFGMERLIALIESTAAEASPDSLTKSIRRALMDFAGGEQTDDDLTLVVVRMSRVPVPESSGLAKTIEIPSDLEQLEACRSFIRSICMQRGRQILDEDAIGLLELAVTEVASNIMIHGQAGFDDPRIRLEGEVFDDSVLVRFDYAGRSFDPTATRPPDFDGSRESGFGVYLTSQCVDQVNYNCKGDGANFIVMIKNRN
ncbi:MAG: SpoIIE family protein phosphatase [Isosphaeraceae bacterium]|nr:SpoIIE family protein phosphatase [Isosphaeraceae bacterium]